MTCSTRQVPLVLGASGLLGSAVALVLERDIPETIAATRAEIDVTDRFRMEAELERLQPTVVINCSGCSDQEVCADAPERAHRLNAEGAESAARATAAVGCRFIHLSTALVFDEKPGPPRREGDPCAPSTEYGRSKLEGERRVAAVNPDHLIIRTSWPYGQGRSNVVDIVRARAGEGGILRVAGDRFGSPTYVGDLAAAVEHLALGDRCGTVHFANAGSCSQYDLAREILGSLDIPPHHLEITSGGDAGVCGGLPASAVLDTNLFTEWTGVSPRPWQDALAGYLSPAPLDRVKG